MSVCFVLEGGAKRGIYTAGVLDTLLENGIHADAVIGVSAGAIHGCSYVSEQNGRSIRYNLKYNDDYRFMSFKSWLKTGNMVETEFAYHELPDKLDVFDHEAFEKSPTKFYVTCTNLETGKAEYIYCDNLRGQNIDYIRASASMPFVSEIVTIKGQKFLDGGIADSIPFAAAKQLGYDKVVVVCTRPKGYRKKKTPLIVALWAKFLYRRYPNFVRTFLNRYQMYNAQCEALEKLQDNPDFLVLRPSRLIKISKMERNPKTILEMYELGRADAQKSLKRLQSFLNQV